jgi:hypothetical protein
MSTKSLCESTHQIVLLRGPTAAAQPLNYQNRESLKIMKLINILKNNLQRVCLLGLIVSFTNRLQIEP